jgi:hypothetical protein
LFVLQIFIGFKYFDDYLIILIFILFLNDQFYKLKHPNINLLIHEQKKRNKISLFLLVIFLIPSIMDHVHLSYAKQLVFYKLGFILWAQAFLVDAYFHYKETHSKQWLLFANTAVLMIVIGAFAI